MIRRGLTILETLLALALLAGLTTAAVSWTVDTQRLAQRVGKDARWEATTLAIADRMCDDLVAFDAADGVPPSVDISDDALSIATRDQGPVEVTYTLDPDGRLVRATEASEPRVLLTGVAGLAMTAVLLDDSDPDSRVVGVIVSIQSTDGATATWTLTLHDREVRP